MDENKAGVPALHGRLTSADILNSQSSLAFGSVPDIQTRQNLESKQESRGIAASEVRQQVLLVSCMHTWRFSSSQQCRCTDYDVIHEV